MTKLEYTFKNDTLFKMLFVKYPDLLKRLVAELIDINFDDIGEFIITNPEMPPEIMGDKFSRLDINMTISGQRVDLEIQVSNRGDYPERSLYYWAREYSTALREGADYTDLPRTIIISIMDFCLFNCDEFHSEFQPLEVTRHTQLTDRMSLHYYELPKLPEHCDTLNGKELWLLLFNAETEEELAKIEALEVPVMTQAIGAYRHVTVTQEFLEIERMRSKARHDEAQELKHERELGAQVEREKWQGVVAAKDAALSAKDAALSAKDAALSEKNRLIAELTAKLNGLNG